MKIRLLTVIALFVLSTFAAYASALLPLVPTDAYLVVNFDFASIVNQPELKAVLEQQMKTSAQDYASFYTRAGIEPARDIKNVMIYLDAKERPCVIVNGEFATAKISELIQSEKDLSANFQIATIGGLQAVKNTANANANMMFVNANTVAFGSEEVLDIVATLQNGKAKNINTNKAFTHLMERVETNANLWGAVVATPNWQTSKNIPVSGLQSMKTGFFSLNYDKEFTMNFTGLVEKKTELPAFIDAMTDLLDAFKGWTASVPEMTEILKSAKIEDNKENLCRIVVSMPAEEFKTQMTKVAEKAAPKK